MKKIISILLSVILLFSLCVMTISKADNTQITYVVYDDMSNSDKMTVSVNGGKLTKYANYISGYNFAQWQQSSANKSLTFTLKNVPAGEYSVSFITADNNQARGIFDITANDVAIGTLNCLDKKLSGKKLVQHDFDTVFTANGTDNVILSIVPQEADTSRQIFLHSIILSTASGEEISTIPSSSTTTTTTTTTTTAPVVSDAYDYVVYDNMTSSINPYGTDLAVVDADDMIIYVEGGLLNKNAGYISGKNYAQWNDSTENISLAFDLKNVPAGEYKLTINTADNTTARGSFDIKANNVELGVLNCIGTKKAHVEHEFDTTFMANGTDNVKISIVPTADTTNRQIFLHSFTLTKVGEYIEGETSESTTTTTTTVVPEESSSTTTTITTTTTTTTTTTQTPSTPDTPSVDADEYVNRPCDYFTTNINANSGLVTKVHPDNSVSFSAEYGLANFSSKYVNSLNCLQWQPSATGILSFKFKDVESGVYKITINSGDHLAQNRSYFDIAVNDDFYETLGFEAGGKTYASHELAKMLTVDAKGDVVVKLTNNNDMNTANGRTTRQTMIESVVLTKVDDVARDPLYVETNMKKGAAIRLNEKNGIRFYTQVDTDAIDALVESGATVELGTLIAPADYIEGKELSFDLEDKNFLNVTFDLNNGYYENDDTFVGSIVNIKESNTAYSAENGNIDRPFVGRGYVKVTKDGKTYINYAKYYDYNVTNNTRSLAQIALAFQGDEANYEQLSDDKKAYVDSMAAKHGSVTYEYFDYSTTNYDGRTISDTGVIMLPKNYSEEGKPVRLVIDCHGYSATINKNDDFYNKYNWAKTLVHDGYAVLGAVENAYHMGTPFAVESYINAYEYVIENYNVYEEVYVNGNSMGGITSINLVCSEKIPVIAHSMQYPVTSIVHQLYYNEWATDTRKRLSNFYGFDFPTDESGTEYTSNTFPFTSDIRTFGTDAELQLLEDNFFDKIVPTYSYYRFTNILNSTKTGFAEGFENFISCNTQEEVNELYSKMTIDYPVPVFIQQCLNDGSVRTNMTKLFENSVKNGKNNGIEAIYYNGNKHGGDIGNDVTYLAKDNTTLSVRESSVKMSEFFNNIENTITDKK